MSSQDHKAAAPDRVRVFVLTVSDTRTDATDTSGAAIIELLKEAGHDIAGKAIEPDEPLRVAELVRQQAAIGDVDAIITSGGTGLTSRDSTFEAIDALLTKRLPGFGELFRMLSYQDIGSAAMMSRACAGTFGNVVVISLPGSEKAVRLAMTKLVIPELTHLVQQATK
ncbi:MAG TPA: MogA/MoaB family molybdenum cofactor biosynthesis protein [Vicinamibacterales bacterium]|nr:MogA/MoaB family molybdenum cofactor biosynthesis protein [Vicinamibacterales bacterium]